MTLDEGEFEWNISKAELNLINHGVSFKEAMTVFQDFGLICYDDIEHSTMEERQIVIGYSRQNRLIMVCFTERESGKIRIISARRATSAERKQYETN